MNFKVLKPITYALVISVLGGITAKKCTNDKNKMDYYRIEAEKSISKKEFNGLEKRIKNLSWESKGNSYESVIRDLELKATYNKGFIDGLKICRDSIQKTALNSLDSIKKMK